MMNVLRLLLLLMDPPYQQPISTSTMAAGLNAAGSTMRVQCDDGIVLRTARLDLHSENAEPRQQMLKKKNPKLTLLDE
eukprot:scaffold21168_cov141-Skeletonema_dohrnii-CCMP3373.AAC.5